MNNTKLTYRRMVEDSYFAAQEKHAACFAKDSATAAGLYADVVRWAEEHNRLVLTGDSAYWIE
jgi:hypothetical protein